MHDIHVDLLENVMQHRFYCHPLFTTLWTLQDFLIPNSSKAIPQVWKGKDQRARVFVAVLFIERVAGVQKWRGSQNQLFAAELLSGDALRFFVQQTSDSLALIFRNNAEAKQSAREVVTSLKSYGTHDATSGRLVSSNEKTAVWLTPVLMKVGRVRWVAPEVARPDNEVQSLEQKRAECQKKLGAEEKGRGAEPSQEAM